MYVYDGFLYRKNQIQTSRLASQLHPPSIKKSKLKANSNRKSCSCKNEQKQTLLIPPSTLFLFACSLLRLPHLLWLRHVAQCGAPAPAAEPCERRHRAAQRQEKQRACSGTGTGAFHGSRKDQSVLKIDQLILGLCRATHMQLYVYLPYLFVQAEQGRPQ